MYNKNLFAVYRACKFQQFNFNLINQCNNYVIFQQEISSIVRCVYTRFTNDRLYAIIFCVRTYHAPVDDVDGDSSWFGQSRRVNNVYVICGTKVQLAQPTLTFVTDVQHVTYDVDGQPAVDRPHCVDTHTHVRVTQESSPSTLQSNGQLVSFLTWLYLLPTNLNFPLPPHLATVFLASFHD